MAYDAEKCIGRNQLQHHQEHRIKSFYSFKDELEKHEPHIGLVKYHEQRSTI